MHDIARFLRTIMVSGFDEGESMRHAQRFYGPASAATKILQHHFQKGALSTSLINSDGDFKAAFAEFEKVVGEKSLLGKINRVSRFRRLPAHTFVLVQTEAPTAQWTRERGMTTAASTAFDQVSIPSRKINLLICATREMLALNGTADYRSLEEAMATPIAKVESRSFIDPDNAGIGEEEPAAITYGIDVQAGTSSPRTDLKELIAGFGGDLETAVFVMSPTTATDIAGEFNDLLGARGGECLGIPVITTGQLLGDSNGPIVALLDPSQILLFDDGISFSQSTTASILVEDSNGAGEHLFSLFQNDVVGILASRKLNWMRARDTAVSIVSGGGW